MLLRGAHARSGPQVLEDAASELAPAQRSKLEAGASNCKQHTEVGSSFFYFLCAAHRAASQEAGSQPLAAGCSQCDFSTLSDGVRLTLHAGGSRAEPKRRQVGL